MFYNVVWRRESAYTTTMQVCWPKTRSSPAQRNQA